MATEILDSNRGTGASVTRYSRGMGNDPGYQITDIDGNFVRLDMEQASAVAQAITKDLVG